VFSLILCGFKLKFSKYFSILPFAPNGPPIPLFSSLCLPSSRHYFQHQIRQHPQSMLLLQHERLLHNNTRQKA
jgi:hypothetical protein